ncbi:MAG: hypothetical protein ACLP59_09725 [Bryobacteraceae bacterium]
MPRILAVLLACLPARYSAVAQPPGAIVIGFVGGMVGHDNPVHSETQLAARLQHDYPTGVHIQLFENRHSSQAHHEILHLLDVNGNGTLSAAEKRQARIAIYGHSWGASEAVNLARTLGREGIPVRLTIQVDSIAKPGEDDVTIPSNVAEAVNFYQRHGLLRGQTQIRAADGSRTEILGNFQFDYAANPVSCKGYPWYARTFMRPHIEIESDPRVWRQVESLIRSKVLFVAH